MSHSSNNEVSHVLFPIGMIVSWLDPETSLIWFLMGKICRSFSCKDPSFSEIITFLFETKQNNNTTNKTTVVINTIQSFPQNLKRLFLVADATVAIASSLFNFLFVRLVDVVEIGVTPTANGSYGGTTTPSTALESSVGKVVVVAAVVIIIVD